MNAPTAAAAGEALAWLGKSWAQALAEVVEGLAGQKPVSVWNATPPPAEPAAAGAPLWWQAEFDLAPGAMAWATAADPAWRALGTHVLSQAGVENADAGEARGTAVEILGQSFGRLAQSLGERLGRAVASRAGSEGAAPPDAAPAGQAELSLPDGTAVAVGLYCSPVLAQLLAPAATAGPAAQSPPPKEEPDAPASPALDLLRDMELPVSVSFGKTQLPLHEVLRLAAGSVIELDRSVNDPVALVVNNTVVALGEVVVIEGNYGLRIQEIMSRERLIRFSGLGWLP
jgi:flagellar motor switch protein FliN/FliY